MADLFSPPMISVTTIALLLMLFHLAFILSSSIPVVPRSRQNADCVISVEGPTSRTLLQTDGYVDDQLLLAVCAAPDTAIVEPFSTIIPTSSSSEVLPSSNIEMSTIFVPPCVNATVLLVFDAMVGKTQLSVEAQLKSVTTNFSCSLTIDYIIAGISIFETSSVSPPSTARASYELPFSSHSIIPSDNDPNTIYTLRSGSHNAFSTTYRNATSSQLYSYDVRIQFPDGSSSSSRSVPDVSSALSGIRPNMSVDASSPILYNSDYCVSIAVADVYNALASDNSTCGLAISAQDGGTPIFALRFQKFKDGPIYSRLNWPEFTSNDEQLDTEEFYNSFFVDVIGDPPPLIEDIKIPRPLYRAGGQVISIVLDNVKPSDTRTFSLGNTSFPELPGSFQRQQNGLYQIQFQTSPGTGIGINWRLTIINQKGQTTSLITSDNISTVLSYSTEPIKITGVEPPWGSDSQVITLTGYFDGFDPNTEGHDILIGEKSLTELGGEVLSVNLEAGKIEFRVPNRDLLGSAYNYPIQVVVGTEISERGFFEYIPEVMNVAIKVFGGIYSKLTGQHVLGACEYSKYVAILPPGVREPERYSWSLITRIDGIVVNILERVSSETILDRSSLHLRARVFGGRGGVFVLSVACNIYGRDYIADVTLRRTGAPVIGVNLPELPSRSLAIPDIPQRVQAVVNLPDDDCFRVQRDVVYEWTYNNITYIFSQANLTDIPKLEVNDISITELDVYVARIGRELIIPQSKLIYGNANITLLVYVYGSEFVSGNATTLLRVKPAELFPVIGNGASRVELMISDNLFMTGMRSKNPDEAYRTGQNIDRFMWKCSLTDVDGYGRECPSDFAPSTSSVSFNVSSSSLRKAQQQFSPNSSVNLLLLYTLTVSVGFPVLSAFSSIVEVDVINDESSSRFATLENLSVKNGRGTLVDRNRIRFYEDLVVEPIGFNVTWIFSVFASTLETNLVDLTANYIMGERYYDPTRNESQALPLGIKAGTLRPSRTYKIRITVESEPKTIGTNLKPSVVIFTVRTVDAPKLLLPRLGIVKGDFTTLFSASARVSVDSNSPYAFFFFLISEDGDEICLDGCSGLPIVQFRILEVGSYQVLVRLRDLQGKPVLDEGLFDDNITVTSNLFDNTSSIGENGAFHFTSYSALLRTASMYGDHGTVQTASSSLARRARLEPLNDDPIVRQAFHSVISEALNHMRGIVFNSVPNVFAARSYIQTANMFSKISPQKVPSSLLFPKLISIVDAAILQVPATEALDIEIDVLTFYNLSLIHLIKPFNVFDMENINASRNMAVLSTKILEQRIRTAGLKSISQIELEGSENTEETDPASLLIAYYEALQKHLSVVLARDALCGSLKSVNTAVRNGSWFFFEPIRNVNISERSNWVRRKTNLTDETYNNSGANEFLELVNGGFMDSFDDFQPVPIPLPTTFSLYIMCNGSWLGTQSVYTHTSSVSRCDLIEENEENEENEESNDIAIQTPENDAYFSHDVEATSEPVKLTTISNSGGIENQVKRLFVLVETMDYGWVTGLVEDNWRTSSYHLITTNITNIVQGSLQAVEPKESICYSLNTTMQRIGATENRGCTSAKTFSESKLDMDKDAASSDWMLSRRFFVAKTKLSQDNSSTILIKSHQAAVMGVVFVNCPEDTDLPRVALPEIADQIPYMFIGATVTVSSLVTVTWTAASANYATLTGAGLSA